MQKFLLLSSVAVFLMLTGCQKKVTSIYAFDNAQSPAYPSGLSKRERIADESIEPPVAELHAPVHEAGSISGKKIAGGQPLEKLQRPLPVQQKAVNRQITYQGAIPTQTVDPDSLIAVADSLARSVDGYIENRSPTNVTLRVPAQLFDTVFAILLTLGEITDFQKSSEDITDAFRDTEQRITILQKTVDRYVQLLALVNKEQEKIKLLKEIEHLREEIETLDVQRKVLSQQAQFATIIFSVIARNPALRVSQQGELKGLGWIALLDPFTTRKISQKFRIPIPEGMVRLKNRNYWMAESPSGTKVWTAKIKNRPAGTQRFWVQALLFRLGEQYSTFDTISVNDYSFIRFTPFPGSSYIYTIGIRVTPGKIFVVQAYFPDQKEQQRYLEAVYKVLGKDDAS